MLTVYKYLIQVTDKFSLNLPKGALVDPKAPTERVWFRFAGTGHPIEERDAGEYVGTFFMHGGALVFYLFRCKKGEIE